MNILKVSRQSINAIEREKYDPGLLLALRLAKVKEIRRPFLSE